MNAVYLHRPDGSETDISICGKCGAPARGKSNFDISERCCVCWICGSPLADGEPQHNNHYHDDCDRTHRATLDMKRLDKAVLVEGYEGPVYCEGVLGGSYGDGYFSDVGELEDMLNDSPEATGIEFAYCCTSSPVALLDVDSIIENETQESFEDAIDHLNGVDELRTAVEVFNEANKDVISWDWDPTRKVRVA